MKLALAFAAAGYAVIPVNVFWDGRRWRKKPHLRDWENRATTGAEQIEKWWRWWPFAMVGVPLARCACAVVDCDRHGDGPDGVAAFHALGPFPPHPVMVTKSGGEHHWFRQPANPIHYAKWEGGEVLGIGHLVIGYAAPQKPIPELPEVFWKANGSVITHNPLGTKAEANALVSAFVPMVCGVSDHQKNYAFRSLRNAGGEL
jgi:hypothetical protein